MKKALFTVICVWFAGTFLMAECIFFKPIEIEEIQVGNLITWSTLTEAGHSKFLIEKSVDGELFETIGEVAGAGDSDLVKDYAFLDLRTGTNNSYYRLKMVDSLAFESVTHTIFHSRDRNNDYVYTSMSSPFTAKHFSLVLDSKVDGQLNYDIINQKQEVLYAKSREISAGSNMISVNLEHFPLGTYKLRTTIHDELEEVVIRKVSPEKHPNIEYVIK
jgi:hypothetical protein